MKSALRDEHLAPRSLYVNLSKACVMLCSEEAVEGFQILHTQGWRVNILYYSLSQKRVEIYINYFQAKSSAIRE